ncbi:MAG: tetratricopeptide repeat protein [Gammaproteobacteria bacterium]|nr:tetratricopeptide repeat protein [Gammaproteobacteria bacterium]
MPLKHLLPLLLALALAACAVQPRYNPYQAPPPPEDESGPVAELQRQAAAALQQQAYARAIELLQRAIRIEPRDPYSWHYLAETYQRSGDPVRCLEMVARAQSYSASSRELQAANERLRSRCEAARGG